MESDSYIHTLDTNARAKAKHLFTLYSDWGKYYFTIKSEVKYLMIFIKSNLTILTDLNIIFKSWKI